MMIPPASNSQFFGHQETETLLLRLIQQNKLPHALLFGGPQGIGKATLAYRLAKYLLSGTQPEAPSMGLFGEEPATETLQSDAEDPAVQRIMAGTHGSLLVIQPEPDEKRKTSFDSILVEQVRRVVDFMHLTSSEGGWRIVIIDPAEAMNNNAANALLKVLEEPPAHTLLILISHQPGRLLPTIRSRCRTFSMQPPTADETAQIFAQQQSGADDATLQQLLSLAQGSPGMALTFHEQDALPLYRQMMACMASGDIQAIQKLAADLGKAPPEQWGVAKAMLLQMIYRLTVFQQLQAQFTPLDDEEENLFQELSTRHPLPHWLALWEKAETLLPQVKSLTLDKKQVLISLLATSASHAKAA